MGGSGVAVSAPERCIIYEVKRREFMNNDIDELIKALDDDGHRESALLLKNWGEMDGVAALYKARIDRGKTDQQKRSDRIGRKGGGDPLDETRTAGGSPVGELEEGKWRKPKTGEDHVRLDQEDTKRQAAFAGKQAVPKAGKAFVPTSGIAARNPRIKDI
jgi:hypothetical protein